MAQTYEIMVGGRRLSFDVGAVANQANGSVLARYGDTVVLVTACLSPEPREGIDFFPLLVDYEERLYSVGKIPGGFIKREGRPGQAATLSARMTDRPIRPLFPEGFRNDVQIVATVLSVEQDCSPDVLALNGASCALVMSDIPFNATIAGVRVGRVEGQFVANPTAAQAEASDLSLVVAGTKDAIMMVEAGAREVPESVVLDAIMFGHEVMKPIIDLIERVRADIGKPKREVPLHEVDKGLEARIRGEWTDRITAALRAPDKLAREGLIDEAKEAVVRAFAQELGDAAAEKEKDIRLVCDKILKEQVRKMILDEAVRVDGRALDEVREVTCAVGVLPRVHGSALFRRGQTQVLTAVTLGAVSDEQLLDDLGLAESKRYMHHYNFPPYSVGEVRPIRGAGRREIGHGSLAERALLPVIPGEDEFPYTMRLVSEVLESNGSTSQASVCGSSLALMDAGVPVRKAVAGVAMGLVKEGDRVGVLTDIQGMEDALGDMDFKVAGTRDGVTAVQMDIKIPGITREILEKALEQARAGRMFIMDRMNETISSPRAELSPYAPRILTIEIDPDKIREVIGPGGKMIRKIIEETGAQIDIEDDGRVFIASVDVEGARKAKEIIENLTRDVEIGRTYVGKVTRIMNFGAFVEILPGKEGLIHISNLARERVGRVEDVVNIGDEVLVKVTEIDRQGRINLSRKDLLPREPETAAPPLRSRQAPYRGGAPPAAGASGVRRPDDRRDTRDTRYGARGGGYERQDRDEGRRRGRP